jgi:LssY C-terminus
MIAAGWSPSDPVTLSSSLQIVGSVAFRRPYHRAPVSPLFFEGRKQDMAFEKPSGRSASTRHHVRFWKTLEAGDDGRPVWLGAATFDNGVGVSHYTGQITHHTAPDIDTERNFLIGDLLRAKKADATYSISGVGPTLFGRNGGGDLFITDGEIDIARLASGCRAENESPNALPPPAGIAVKNAAFSWFANLWRRLSETTR